MDSYQSGYGDVSYDPNGYLNFVPTPDYGTNPWTSVSQAQQGNYNTAQNAAATQIPGMQNQLQSQVDAYNQAINANAYPSFPNAGGLGTQAGYGTAQPQTSDSNSQPGTRPRGLNPWSLQGEALSRLLKRYPDFRVARDHTTEICVAFAA